MGKRRDLPIPPIIHSGEPLMIHPLGNGHTVSGSLKVSVVRVPLSRPPLSLLWNAGEPAPGPESEKGG